MTGIRVHTLENTLIAFVSLTSLLALYPLLNSPPGVPGCQLLRNFANRTAVRTAMQRAYVANALALPLELLHPRAGASIAVGYASMAIDFLLAVVS